LSTPSREAKELKGVLDMLKVIAEEQTRPSFRTYADIVTPEIIFSIIAFIILIFGVLNQQTLGELGLPTTITGVGIIWLKSLKDGYDKVKILAENEHNNMVFYNLLDNRISRLDNIQDPQEKKDEILEIKEQLSEWCKSMVGSLSDKCPYT